MATALEAGEGDGTVALLEGDERPNPQLPGLVLRRRLLGAALLALNTLQTFTLYTAVYVVETLAQRAWGDVPSVTYVVNLYLTANFLAAVPGGYAGSRGWLGGDVGMVVLGAVGAAAASVVCAAGAAGRVPWLLTLGVCLYPFAVGMAVPSLAVTMDAVVEGEVGVSQFFWMTGQMGSAVAEAAYNSAWTADSWRLYLVEAVLGAILCVTVWTLGRSSLVTGKAPHASSGGSSGGMDAVKRAVWVLWPVVPFYAVFFQIFSLFAQTFGRSDGILLGVVVSPTAAASINPLTEIGIIGVFRLVLLAYGSRTLPADAASPAAAQRGAAWLATLGLACAVLTCIWGAAVEAAMADRAPNSVSALWAAGPYVLVSFAEVLFTTNVLRYAALLHPDAASLLESVFFAMIGLGATGLDLVTFLASLGRSAVAQYLLSAAVILLSGIAFFFLTGLARPTRGAGGQGSTGEA
jgi:hypothetical protein